MFPGGKGGRCVGMTSLPPSCANCFEIWEPQPPGTLRACPGMQWDLFTLVLLSALISFNFQLLRQKSSFVGHDHTEHSPDVFIRLFR